MSNSVRFPEKTVLVVSNSEDSNWAHLGKALKKRGYKMIVYEADKVADGRTSFEILIGKDGKMRFRYAGRFLDLSTVASAWYRRPRGFENKLLDAGDSLERNQGLIQYSLWRTIQENAWLNHPRQIQYAEHKLDQLQVAHQIGFIIPQTVIANRWRSIEQNLPKSIIFKLPHCQLETKAGSRIVPTTHYKNKSSTLPKNRNPFPGLWQPLLDKAREWRIVVVGDKVFAGAIYTQAIAKHDWRMYLHKRKGLVEFRKENFPESEKKKCIQYLKRFGLRYGAFDFVENHEGKITFLECNANGQYGELENFLKSPITETIADELIKIAKDR